MKTFVINLDKNPDRLASMKRQLDAFGIEFERFPAIYGKNLTKAELRRCYNRFRSILVNGKPMQLGEIGCALSHALVYKRMIEENIPVALIFEDDVQFLPRFPEVLKYASEQIDLTKKQVILFNAHGVSNPPTEGNPKVVPIVGGLCAEAYLITLPAAREIARVNYPIVIINDKWLRFQEHFGVEMYRALPMTEKQDKTVFSTSDVLQKHEQILGVKRVFWKLARAVEVALDRLIILITGR